METIIKLYNGDCLEIIPSLNIIVDLIIVDPPYGSTQCRWDNLIPVDKMWDNINKLIKPNGAVVIFGTEPFCSIVRNSNINNYKYDWIWIKDKATNHLNVKKMPMRKTEKIMVFYKKQCEYNPQIKSKKKENVRPPTIQRKNVPLYGNMNKLSKREISKYLTYPNELLEFKKDKVRLHPTQKPVKLIEYLIKTYTNESQTVLDFTSGSCSTGIACMRTNRKFIGIELEKDYFDISLLRISKERNDVNFKNECYMEYNRKDKIFHLIKRKSK